MSSIRAPALPGLETPEPSVIKPRRIAGRVGRVLTAAGDDFQTVSVDALTLDFNGVAGDGHRGSTRRSGGREPWYPRGTEMRNERQVSIVSFDDLAAVAAALGVAEVRPEWLGANLVIEGVPRLSWLPPRTRLFFKNGVTLAIEGQNAPCRKTGAGIASHVPGRPDIELLFPKVAKRLRGLVAWVEKPGSIEAGESVEARLPEQWIYG